ncbi:phosphogluconate dehydrogenase (NAD(+)-dependent, decarboxylating) [Haloechinothrix halophila]|uniref:phosphogluconate dehydrogenase (NAD(+)-dependent, decarboxylating) n=1 Tax=Haloechinothrix halophila TaxID=1069073 RepID=UPI0003FE301D|nr:decarboxylating 6-phosphogluconate dehydrogenase [Haloechinothrix halophila]
MQVGMIGAGRMGTNLVRRLLRERHECVVYDADSEAVSQVETYGALGATSIPDLVSKLQPPRVVWVMVPAALTGAVVDELATELTAGDVVIDGGNSYYRDDVTRADALAEHGIDYVDVGTSGGVFGLDRGFCLMIGGKADVVARLDPVFRALAPGVDVAARTPGRVDEPSTEERGYLHCGPAGAGHFVKMVHNGIEYGQMAALAEGLAILRKANIGMADRESSAEAAPLGDAEFYRYDFDIAAIAEMWRRGSVISSWLVDLTAAALRDDPELAEFTGQVADSGEGRWTVQAAVDEGVPAYVLTAALYERFSSRNEGDYADKALSAMRKAFGGHMEVGSNR